tara:strand:+ start:523 stop:687 length:165 start_codon:yes stop_codon:yes gene_type:complete
MNIMKFMLAAFFVVCVTASVTGCKHTDEARSVYGSYKTGGGGGELLVPLIRLAF